MSEWIYFIVAIGVETTEAWQAATTHAATITRTMPATGRRVRGLNRFKLRAGIDIPRLRPAAAAGPADPNRPSVRLTAASADRRTRARTLLVVPSSL